MIETELDSLRAQELQHHKRNLTLIAIRMYSVHTVEAARGRKGL
jgi:hypothetical protein